MAFTVPFHMMGMWVSGDIGDFTVYTDRFGRKTAFPRSPPDKPPSPQQTVQRNAFAAAQSNWSSLTTDEKAALELVTNRVGLCLTGQNLWIHVLLRKADELLVTLEHQTGIQLPTPP